MFVNTFLAIIAALIIGADVAALPAQLANPSPPAPIVRNVSDAARVSSGGCFMTPQGGPSAGCVIRAPSAAQEAPQGAIMPPSSGNAGLAALAPTAAQRGAFDACPALTRIPFDYSGPASACGLAEDAAFSVWAYFNVRPWESAQRFASWQDDGREALNTAEIERWIVIHAAQDYAAQHFPAYAQGEIIAALDGLSGWAHGLSVAPEWIDAYGRLLRP